MTKKRTMLVVLSLLLMGALAAGLLLGGCGGEKKAETEVPTTTDTTEETVTAKRVLLILPNSDFNDTEYTTTRSVLEGAGYEVTVANTSGQDSSGMEGSKATPDLTVGEVDTEDFQAVVFIGGSGAAEYFDNPQVVELAGEAASMGEVVAAICIAPVILANAGLLEGKEGTVSSSQKEKVIAKGCSFQETPCVVEGKIITASGPDASEEFADAIVKALK